MKDIYGFWTFKKVQNFEKKLMRAHTTLIQSERPFLDLKLNNTSRNNWKPSFDGNFSKNSTKTIRLFALDFYEVIVDLAGFGLIN